MALDSGTKLGPYEIQSLLGAGGMGEVYQARDTRLNRSVAVKVLPSAFSSDSDRLHRFEQEARVLSALNHPNLLAIYDIGSQDGVHYLVSELLEGESLRERLNQGPLPLRKLVDSGVQIAKGLAAAHEKGIVHRDLKPDNVFLTKDGRAKILDFGLAKQAVGGSDETAATMSAPGTQPGAVMGTVGYMSPEQVRGKIADRRSDIFSFGAILYEMVSGQRAFQGESSVETLNAILKDDPPEIPATNKNIPPALDRMIRRCLEKAPDERFQSASDLAFAIEALSGSSSGTTVQAPAVERSPAWIKRPSILLAGAVLALAAATLAAFLIRPRTPHAERLEFSIPLPEETGHLAISADGRMLAFVSPDPASGANMLDVQRIGSLEVAVLAGTEGASYPFWSPDNAYVAFFADGKLKKIAASGGVPQVLASATTGRGGSWGRSGVIIYAPQAAGWLWKVNADGSNVGPLSDKFYVGAKEASHRWPVFLPDGEHFLFLAGNLTHSGDDAIYLSSLNAKEKRLLVSAVSNPGYANGFLFYVDEKKSLRATPLDFSKGTSSAEPQVIANQVGFQTVTNWGAFSVAETGTVVYNPTAGTMLSVLTWFDRAGKEQGHVGDVGVLSNPSLSPDDRQVAVDVADIKASNVSVWLSNVKSGTSSRFTFDPSEDVAGIWSRDGALVIYRADFTHIAVKQAQGLQPAKLIFNTGDAGANTQATDDIVPTSWSRDDKEILCSLQPGAGGSQLVVIPAMGGKSVPFLATKAETNGQISPDGRWVAYASHESGDWEIYVTTFPGAAGKWQVSRGGGIEPRWRGDGKEIFYIGPKSTLMAVASSTEGTFSAGNPMPLFRTQLRAQVSSTDLFSYDVAKDGQRFLVNRYAKPQQVAPLHIVLNATGGLVK
jgi:Tol biopolymer transport system component